MTKNLLYTCLVLFTYAFSYGQSITQVTVNYFNDGSVYENYTITINGSDIVFTYDGDELRATSTSADIEILGTSTNADVITAGSPIDGSSTTFTPNANLLMANQIGVGPWDGEFNKYLGFRVDMDPSASIAWHYGWVEATVIAAYPNEVAWAIYSYAYHNDPDTVINAGELWAQRKTNWSSRRRIRNRAG